ncbi:hypothetical protein SAMN04488074_105100 [Lentzea albidocapillata subsp. violacea]|uniref:Uncharacterized protein n=1 Tax=Lentzea albidocapillata subsp. violacea TaxID=128104 RepID=A0A1G9ARP1_9PSEU|nr:hypothetical protein [Lentzea albidocapillata]SDK29968.1 hypothetical protein SAMN04488074_105100 [Lentzea albidocapillata subsp. violacea]
MSLAAGNHATAARLNALGRLVGQTTWTVDSATFTTSEVMLQTLTVPAFTGINYWVLVDAGWTNTLVGTGFFLIRAAGGASVTTSTPKKAYARKRRIHTATAFDDFQALSQVFSDVTPSGGQITVGLSAYNDAGTGKLEADADNIGWMAVFAQGLA